MYVVLNVKAIPPWIREHEVAVLPSQFPMDGPIFGSKAHDLVSVAKAQQQATFLIELDGIPMQIVHSWKQQVVQIGVHRQVIQSAPLLKNLLLRVQMKQPRIEDFGVGEAANARQIFKHFLEQHHQVRSIVEAMHVVVVVVWGKRLRQGVQWGERRIHHGPLAQAVVVPHKFTGAPRLHVKSAERGLLRPSHVRFVVDERGKHARGALNE